MRRYLVILISLLALSFFGCPSGGGGPTTDPVVGTWNLTSTTYDGTPELLSFYGWTSFTITVESNGTWSGVQVPISGPNANTGGTWSVSGSTYTIDQTSPSAGSLGTAMIFGNTMTQTMPNNPSAGHTTVFYWTKQ